MYACVLKKWYSETASVRKAHQKIIQAKMIRNLLNHFQQKGLKWKSIPLASYYSKWKITLKTFTKKIMLKSVLCFQPTNTLTYNKRELKMESHVIVTYFNQKKNSL